MHLRLRYHRFLLRVLLLGTLCLAACENDLNKVKAIAAADATKPIQSTTNVNLIYSDSAKVKFQITSPLLLEYTIKNPYKELPKGVKVIFFEADGKQAGSIVSDSAIMKNDDKLIEFFKNVVATNTQGTVYKSEELIWDMAKKQVFSKQKVEMTKVGGDVMYGTSFTSDDKLLNPKFQNATGVIHVNGESLAQ